MSEENSISKIANITRGLTNRVEICVINNIGIYNFNIDRPNQSRVVERPRLPSLVIGQGGIIQEGLTNQEKSANGSSQNFGSNHYELIEKNRYSQVKELLGYMGLKTPEYHIFKVINKDIETGISYINCGFGQPIDVDGTIYSPDTGSGGSSFRRPLEEIVSGGKWTPIYKSARSVGQSGNGTLSWSINTNSNTSHKIILRFADFWNSNGTANIYINGWKRKENFNIINRVGGPFKRTDVSFRVPVTNNKIELSIRGRGHLNAIDVYRLDKGDVDFIEADRDDLVVNKDAFLFVNKNINISVDNLKRKFLEIQGSVLKSRNLFLF